MLADYLDVLTGRGQGQGWIELRYRHNRGMRTRFYPARGPHHALERRVALLSPTRDVYLGCALRRCQRGDREHVGQAWTLWAECDGLDARTRLDAFPVEPSLVIASGTPGNVHVYWALDSPADADALEDANRRLAEAIGADPVCYDAARILRPPGTLNHKHAPPRAVEQLVCSRRAPYARDEVIADLPSATPHPAPTRRPRVDTSDPLLAVDPAVYVPQLTGRAVGRDGKVSCPFHEDRTPSLHVYPTPERGWHCFSCRRGGSIYDLAALAWEAGADRRLRGRDFVEVRQRLLAIFVADRPAN